MPCLRLGLWLGSHLSTGVVLGVTVSAVTWLASAGSGYACEFFSVPQRFNTQVLEDVIVIGGNAGQPYRVVVPSDDPAMLTEIRACVLDAFVTRSSHGGALPSRFGPYIQVGRFSRRSDAEVVRRVLKRSGYSARVTYGR